jgi:hypothetical protein
MATVKAASMLFSGGANRRSVDVFWLVSRLVLESVLVLLLMVVL